VGTDFDTLKSKRQPRTKTVAVAIDEGTMEQIATLERAIPVQRHIDETENRPPKAAKLEEQLERLRAEAQQVAEEFTFQELSRPKFRDLITAHPSEDKGLRWDEDTFAPALLHACCFSHDFTLEQWQELWAEWGNWITAPLFATAYEVCDEPSRVPFGWRKSGEIRGSETNSATAGPEESPTPSS